MGDLILLRHGQTQWSAAGRHTGRTDVPLTAKGAADAAALAPALGPLAARGELAAVLVSPAQRATRTAELAGLAGAGPGSGSTGGARGTGSTVGTVGTGSTGSTVGTVGTVGTATPDPDLWEWDYGGYEGMTTQEIRRDRPGWYLWRDGVTGGDATHPGETVQEVGARADRVLKRATPLLGGGDVVLVAHGHVLRVLTARWLGLAPSDGRLFRLDTGTICTLGTEHGEPVILTWNVPPPAPASGASQQG